MTLDYVKERKQFGVPVGSFQAVSHRCAQMLLHTECGALGRRTSPPGRPMPTPSGCPRARRWPPRPRRPAAARSPPAAIQNHGGIGFTWEADVHWLYKRAELDRALLGSTARHHATLARIAAQRLAAAASTAA